MNKVMAAAWLILVLGLSLGYLASGEGEAAMPEKETETESEKEQPQNVSAEKSELVLPMKKRVKTVPKSEENVETAAEVDYQIVVNRDHPLPEDFSPEIVEIAGRNARGEKQAAAALIKMLAAGEREGLRFVVCSGYRTADDQRKLYLNQIQKKLAEGYPETVAVTEAEKYSALPGRSEHQTGLAFDIVALSYQNLDEGYASTPEAIWLKTHAETYGFILRYPEDKEDVTGIGYEPWHFRYVGCIAARAMMRGGLTLEEWRGD